MPFDPTNIPASTPPGDAAPARASVWPCQICNRQRFSYWEIAYEGAVVIATGEPTGCGLCGDGCFVE